MIEQGFNYTDSNIKDWPDIFETRVENMEPKEDKKKFSAAAMRSKKSIKKKNREDSDSSVVESSKESTKAYFSNKKYCILHGKCSHCTDSFKDPRAMVNKHKQKKIRNDEKRKKELNALIEKIFQKFIKNKKRRKTVTYTAVGLANYGQLIAK